MRSNILSLAAFAFAGLFATAQAEVWWTLYFDVQGGYFCLKDVGGKLQTVSMTSLVDVEDSKDKGFRWAFKDGKLESQLNEGKFVGFDDEMQVWRTTYGTNDTVNLAAASIEDMVATACRKTECVGSAGQRSDSFGWRVANIPYVQGS